MASIRKRGSIYYLRTYDGQGRSKDTSLKTTSRRVAVQALADYHRAQEAKAFNVDIPADCTFDDAIKAYIEWATHSRQRQTISNVVHCVKRLVRVTNHMYLGDVTPGDIERCKMLLKMQGFSNSTVNMWLAACKGFYNRIQKLYTPLGVQMFNRPNPFAKVERFKLAHKLPTVLTEDQVEKIIAKAKELQQPYALLSIVLGRYFGLRRGEISACRWEHFRWGENPVLIVQSHEGFRTKTGKCRQIPVSQQALDLLKPYVKESGYVVRPQSEGNEKNRIMYEYTSKPVIDATGIHYSPNILRHTFCSYYLRKNVSISKVAQWAGNTVAVMEQHYSNLSGFDGDINA